MIRYKGTSNSGVMPWFFQRISGLFLVLLLLVHFWVLHYSLEGDVTYRAIARRVATPFWKTIDMSFLVLALFHGLNGIWMVVEDYVHVSWARISIFSIICLLGLILLIVGSITILPFRVGF